MVRMMVDQHLANSSTLVYCRAILRGLGSG